MAKHARTSANARVGSGVCMRTARVFIGTLTPPTGATRGRGAGGAGGGGAGGGGGDATIITGSHVLGSTRLQPSGSQATGPPPSTNCIVKLRFSPKVRSKS